jgi:hypothetical protein
VNPAHPSFEGGGDVAGSIPWPRDPGNGGSQSELFHVKRTGPRLPSAAR